MGLGKSKKGNDFLDQFFDQLPSKKTETDIRLERDISFDYLFETSSNNFVKNVKTNEVDIDMEIYTYKGSLTTPPYTEGVNWMVSKTTHFINNKQLKKLSACWNHENNARPCQDYCGRQVKLRNKSSLQVVSYYLIFGVCFLCFFQDIIFNFSFELLTFSLFFF